MQLKKDVRVRGIQPETVVGMMVADSVFKTHGHNMVVTSCTEGKHSWTSLHYSGAAFDIRTRDIPADDLAPIIATLKGGLGPDFDVILEDSHIHIEHQPKGE